MSRPLVFLSGVVTGVLLLYAAMKVHIIRSSDGFNLVAKRPARLSETFVDIRAFSMTDWASRPQLASAIVQADKQHLLGGSATEAVQESMNRLLPEWSSQ
jgi:hypothetical protein